MTGREVNVDSPWSPPCWKIAYVRHFLTQSTSHFIEHRFNKVDCCGNIAATPAKLVDRYFTLNKRTPEKEQMFLEALKD